MPPVIDRNLFGKADSLKSGALDPVDDEMLDDVDALSEGEDEEIDRIIDEIEAEHQSLSNAASESTASSPSPSDAVSVSAPRDITRDDGDGEYLPSWPSTSEQESATFRSLGLRKKLERTLHSVHGLHPLPIQRAVFERAGRLRSDHLVSGCIVNSGMGTGKTLSYLLPILNRMKPLQCGQAVVVVPSAELAVQVKAMAKSYLIHHDDFRRNHRNSSYLGNAVGVDPVGDSSRRRQFLLQHAVMSCDSSESLDLTVDRIAKLAPSLIIGTAKRIRELFLYSVLKPSQIEFVVFDEVDALFPIRSKYDHKEKKRQQKALEHSHLKPSQLILNGILKQQSGGKEGHRCQVMFVGATIPNQLRSQLVSMMTPHPVDLIVADGLHQTPHHRVSSSSSSTKEQFAVNPVHRLISPNIVHQFVAVDGAERKGFIVAELIRKIRADPKQKKLYNPAVLVFVAKESSPREFAETLSEHEVKCAVLHEHCAEKAARSRFLKMFRNGEVEAVVATESVARGLDFIWLDHLIVAEVPFQDTSYLHIAGRCSRLHSKGFVTSVVDEFDEERLKRHCFKYNIELRELDDDRKIDALSKQKRKYNKLNTFPLLLTSKPYHKRLRQQLYLQKSGGAAADPESRRGDGVNCL